VAQYVSAYPTRHGDDCILVLPAIGQDDEGARFFTYRSEKGDLTRWTQLGPDRTGMPSEP